MMIWLRIIDLLVATDRHSDSPAVQVVVSPEASHGFSEKTCADRSSVRSAAAQGSSEYMWKPALRGIDSRGEVRGLATLQIMSAGEGSRVPSCGLGHPFIH